MWSELKTSEKIYLSAILIIVIIFTTIADYFQNKNNCSTVAVIPITGELVSSPRYNSDGSLDKSTTVSIDVVAKIRKAERNSNVKAIVLVIDSLGGNPESAEEI